MRGSRLKPWKTKPMVRLRSARGFVLVEAGDVPAGEEVAPAAGAVEAAEDVHEGRLARAGGAHDGDELTRADVQVDLLQGGEGAGRRVVVLAERLDADDRFCH
jgi:hypothetical protein